MTKLLVGAGATALMAMVSHGWLNLGSRFIDGLESDAKTALGAASGAGVSLSFEREPALRRIAILSGDGDTVTRARLLAAVRAVPGVADARWVDNDAAPAAASTRE